MRTAAALALGFVGGGACAAALTLAIAASPGHAAERGQPAPLAHPIKVTLHRLELKPDKLDRFDDWMRLYETDHRATVATLERERTYVEAMFRDRKGRPDVVWWLEAQGQGGARVEGSPLEIDRKHLAFMDEVLKPHAHTTLDTEFVLMPDFVVEAIRAHQAAAPKT